MQALDAPSEKADDAAQHLSDLAFAELELSDALRMGIADAGFERCTPIQAQSLPIALDGRDVAGQAQTGTGKTAAYLIAMYQHLSTHPPLAKGQDPRATILAPTRELAMQIHKDAVILGSHLPYRLGLVYGGTDYDKQRQQLEAGVDVLIGTPGRLIDYFKQRIFSFKRCQVMILDEADRMFDLGFIKDIRFVLRRLPPRTDRLNMLFSATLSHRVLELAYEHMNDPELLRIAPDKMTVDQVRQSIYFPSNEEKIPLLITLLKSMGASRTMVFVNTRRAADRVCDALEQNGINAAAISGDVPQRKRQRMMAEFHSGALAVLIGTDVASRGLHVPGVSHVFNFDLPQDPEDYVHRIGRTARAGASGDAISFGCEDYAVSLPDIEAYISRKIPVAQFDHDDLVEVTPTRPRPRRSNHAHNTGRSRGGGKPRGGRKPRDRASPSAGDSHRNANTRADSEPARDAPVDGGPKRRKRRRKRSGKTEGKPGGDQGK